MAKKPPACRHSTSMMPPMKLDMSNLAWENSGDELVLLPSPEGKEKEQFDGKLHESSVGWEKKRFSHFFSEKALRGIFIGGNDLSGVRKHFTQLLWE